MHSSMSSTSSSSSSSLAKGIFIGSTSTITLFASGVYFACKFISSGGGTSRSTTSTSAECIEGEFVEKESLIGMNVRKEEMRGWLIFCKGSNMVKANKMSKEKGFAGKTTSKKSSLSLTTLMSGSNTERYYVTLDVKAARMKLEANRGGGGSGSGLSRGNSQFSNLGAARTSSTSFLKRNGSSKSQSGFAKGIISGGAASRTFVFGSALDNSNSQWATTQRETETMPSSLGNNLLGGDEARTGFGDDVANNNINSSASVMENKKKSLFSMLQKSTKDEDWEKDDDQGQGIKNVLGM